MAMVKKKNIVKLAKKYFGDDYVVGYRRDGEQYLPAIDKPELAALEMDRSRQSKFAAYILAMPVESVEPEYVIPGRDFTTRDVRDDIELYHTANPMNDLLLSAGRHRCGPSAGQTPAHGAGSHGQVRYGPLYLGRTEAGVVPTGVRVVRLSGR
jgi:hypothetical protein